MSTSIGDLVQRVRWKTNTESSTFVTDQELTTYVNDNLGELDDALIATYEDYKLTSASFTIASSVDGSNHFNLPSDFLKSRRVELLWGSDYVTLEPFSLQERSRLTHPVLIRNLLGGRGWYRIEGAICEILPWQSAAGTYRLWYVVSFTPLAATFDSNGAFTASTATLPAYMDTQAWHAAAVAGACANVLQKQDLDAGIFLAEKAQQLERIKAASKSRDAGYPKCIVDTRGGRGRGRGGWGGGRGGWG